MLPPDLFQDKLVFKKIRNKEIKSLKRESSIKKLKSEEEYIKKL